ncbi:6-phosphogluconate dehydrogenase [Tanacetum coccineum]
MGVTECFSGEGPSFVIGKDYKYYRQVEGMLQGIAVTKHTKFIEAVKWTVHESVDSSVAAPTIAMSLNTLAAEPHKSFDNDVSEAFIRYVEKALCASILSTYIQGIKMIEAREKSIVNILRDIVKVWKVHCFIDPKCLDDLYMAYDKYHKYKLEDFILEPCQFKEKGDNKAKEMSERMTEMHSAWKKVINKAIECDISVNALSFGLKVFEEFYRKIL